MKNGQIEEYRFAFQRPPGEPSTMQGEASYVEALKKYAPAINNYFETIWDNFSGFFETLHKIGPKYDPYYADYEEKYGIKIIEGYYCYFEEWPEQLLLFYPSIFRYNPPVTGGDRFYIHLSMIEDSSSASLGTLIYIFDNVDGKVDYGEDVNDYEKGTIYINFDVLTLFDIDNNKYKFVSPPNKEWHSYKAFTKIKLYDINTDKYVGLGIGQGVNSFTLGFNGRKIIANVNNIPFVSPTSQCPPEFVIKDNETLIYTKNIIGEYYMIGFGKVWGKSQESKFANETSNPRHLMKFSKIIGDKDLYYKPLSDPKANNYGIFFFKDEDTSSSTT